MAVTVSCPSLSDFVAIPTVATEDGSCTAIAEISRTSSIYKVSTMDRHATLPHRDPRVTSGAITASAYSVHELRLLEQRALCLSTWMIHNANHLRTSRDGMKVGGHQSSSASSVTLLTALYCSAMRPQDRIAVKPHASPPMHAIQYLLVRQSRDQLERFRALGGAQSYPLAHEGRCGRLRAHRRHREFRPQLASSLCKATASARPLRRGEGNGSRSPLATWRWRPATLSAPIGSGSPVESRGRSPVVQ